MHIKRQINQFLEKKNNIYIDIIKNKTNGDYIHLNRQTVAKKKTKYQSDWKDLLRSIGPSLNFY